MSRRRKELSGSDQREGDFIIGIWMEVNPVVLGYTKDNAGDFYRACFAKIQSIGFNTVRPSNFPHHWGENVRDIFMNLARDYNLRVIMDPGEGHNLMKYNRTELEARKTLFENYLQRRVIDTHSGHSNLLGYAVIDEPSIYNCRDLDGNPVNVSIEEKLSRWHFIRSILEEKDPGHPDYTVFTDPSSLSYAATHYEFKRIVYDNYPFKKKVGYYRMGPDNVFNWYTRYKLFNAACRKRPDAPQVSVVQAFSGGVCPWRFPKPEELRVSVYTSLAAGAKGIIFFLYQDMLPGGTANMSGLVNSNHNANDAALYDTVVKLNRELRQIGPLLADLTSSSGGVVNGWENNFKVLTQPFTDSSGNRYVIIANKNPDPGSPDITETIPLSGSHSILTDIYTGETFSADSSGVAAISLAHASGRVLKEIVNKPDEQLARMTGPVPGSSFEAPDIFFEWTPGINVERFMLFIGTTRGEKDIYREHSSSNVKNYRYIKGLPTNGQKVWVRLRSRIDERWGGNHIDYEYNLFDSSLAPLKATIISPLPMSCLRGSTVTFKWTAGAGVERYMLYVGTDRGKNDIYTEYSHKNTERTVSTLPTDGSIVYVRLRSRIGGRWGGNHFDYKFRTKARH